MRKNTKITAESTYVVNSVVQEDKVIKKTSVLFQILEAIIERTMIQYHYRNEYDEMKTSHYLSASNGTMVYVSNLFVRDLDKHWVNLLLICGSNAESQTLTHEALVKWRTTGKRLE